MTLMNFLDLLVIALWVLIGFPLLAYGFWVLHKYNRSLKELEVLYEQRRARTSERITSCPS